MARVTIISVALVLSLIPVWAHEFYVTQDGPSHLYNSFLLEHTTSAAVDSENEGALSKYFSLRGVWVPNSAGHLLLSKILRIVGPLDAEQVLITIYLVFLFASFSLLIPRRVAPHVGILLSGCLPFVALNAALHLGFFAFCLSLPPLLLSIYLSSRYFAVVGPLLSGLLVATVWLAALFHPLSGLLTCGVVDVVFVLRVIVFPRLRRRLGEPGETLPSLSARGWTLVLVHLVPLWIVVSLFRDQSDKGVVSWEGMAVRLSELLYSGLLGIHSSVVSLCVGMMLLTLGTLCFTGICRDIRSDLAGVLCGKALSRVELQVLLLIFLTLYFLTPEGLAGGSFIGLRIGLLFFVFLLTLLPYLDMPLAAGYLFATLMLLLSGANIFCEVERQQTLNAKAQSYSEVLLQVPPESTLLPLHFNLSVEEPQVGTWSFFDPLKHVAGYIGVERKLVLLSNYEAAHSYFPVQYREKVSPFGSILPTSQFVYPPRDTDLFSPRFWERSGEVDYVVTWSIEEAAEELGPSSSPVNILRQLSRGYRRIERAKEEEKILLFAKER